MIAGIKQMNKKERDHLKLLSIFHYVYGGLITAFLLFYLSIFLPGFISLLSSPQTSSFPSDFEWSYFWGIFLLGGFWLLIGLTFPICLIASGRFLAKRKRYWYSLIVACINCFFWPFGTILGVFTIIVLSRDSVRSLYGLSEA